MIIVDGHPFPTNSSQGNDTLASLLEHPSLVSASHSLKSMQEKKFSSSEDSGFGRSAKNRWVYVFQREYATVDPALVDFVCTDEATTCVGLVIRNPRNGMTSIAHLDSPKIVDVGLTQILSRILDHNFDVNLDVHLIGGFEDISPNHANSINSSKTGGKSDGHSFPLCSKIIETLGKRRENFEIRTLYVLGHNTRRDSQGNAYPIFHGFLVETSSGSLTPACFDRTTRCPDEIVRRIRITTCYEDSTWNERLLETYDTQTDRFVIAPCYWSQLQLHIALSLQHLSDAEILVQCSTSPFAEGPEFVDNLKRKWDYLIKHPDWQDTFPMKQPRIFERNADGTWKRSLSSSSSSSSSQDSHNASLDQTPCHLT